MRSPPRPSPSPHRAGARPPPQSLILRLYEPTSGQILLDGNDVSRLDPRYLRHHVTAVQQEPPLFSMTVRENIAYCLPDGRVPTPAEARNTQSTRHAGGVFRRGYSSAVPLRRRARVRPQMDAAIRVADLEDVIRGLPQGLDTMCGERGVRKETL